MAKKVLVILGHPKKQSYNGALADAYATGAEKAGADVRRIYLGDLDFDPVLRHGYHQIQELENDLKIAQDNISWAEHLVFVYPVWWGAMPALLKGFIDRIFLPGFAFKYIDQNKTPEQYLKGRSAHLIITMDGPAWYYNWIMGAPGDKMMKKAVLNFSGTSPVRITRIGSLISYSEGKKTSG